MALVSPSSSDSWLRSPTSSSRTKPIPRAPHPFAGPSPPNLSQGIVQSLPVACARPDPVGRGGACTASPLFSALLACKPSFSGSSYTHGTYRLPDRAIDYLHVLLSLRHCVRENNALRLVFDGGDRQECAGHLFSTSSEVGAPHASPKRSAAQSTLLHRLHNASPRWATRARATRFNHSYC